MKTINPSLFLLFIGWMMPSEVVSFTISQPSTICSTTTTTATTSSCSIRCRSSNNYRNHKNNNKSNNKSQLFGIGGDPFRAATGIRPSLHPVTINAIAEALRQRAKSSLSSSSSSQRDDPNMVVLVRNNRNYTNSTSTTTTTVTPLQMAQAAGKIAVDAIVKRQETSTQDGMKLTPEEEQTIAGRVVGVVLRFDELETILREKCKAKGWIAKYQEWSSFGLLANETHDDDQKAVDEQILMDPLFCMNRAECLLALFLSRVEEPSLMKSQQQVPGGSVVDFLDADRREVLVDSYQ